MPVLEEVGSFAMGNNEDGEPLFDSGEIASVRRKLPVVAFAAQLADQSPLPVEARLVGDQRYTFFQLLKRDSVLVEVGELGGEARMLAKIQRKIPKGKPESISLMVPGMAPSTNRAQRRKKSHGQQATRDSALILRHPAAIVTPIGIYR